MNDSISDDQALEALLSSAQSNEEAKVKKLQRNEKKRRKWDSRDLTMTENNDNDSSYGGGRSKINNNDNSSNHRLDYYGRAIPYRNNRNNDERDGYYGDGKREAYSNSSNSNSNNNNKTYEFDRHSKRQRNFNRKNEEKNDMKYSWGDQSKSNFKQEGYNEKDKQNTKYSSGDDEEESKSKKVKPNFGLSGALAEDEKTGNTYNGIVLKFSEPSEARTPNTRWRLYVFKKKNTVDGSVSARRKDGDNDDGLLQTLHISRQSAYLFGREHKVADIPVDHPSLSKQHCVIQYRALPCKADREQRIRCKPYLMDLGSTNGTFLNGVRIDDARYYELRKGDVITLGASTREYVLLTENTTLGDL